MTSPTAEAAWTLGRLLDWTAGYLKEKGAEFPRLDAEVLLAHAAGCRRIDLYTRYAEPASDEVRGRYRDMVRRRVEGCPVAYLVGRKEFYSLEFEVSPAVLIPRPDTETLVVAALDVAKITNGCRILDVGTGSGAIAVALAKHLPSASLVAVDISTDALAVARRNAERHGVADRVRFLQSDLLAAVAGEEAFDLIVSNPPYIAAEEVPRLPAGVRDFEPRVAVDGGPGGYRVVERLLPQAARQLRPGGWLLLEIGAAQETAVRQLFDSLSGLTLSPTILDHGGRPRVLRARRNS